ncbi:MAG TPA: hypothetical protein VKA08_06620 [Balneolales bacterium]|nr:hypothetical protein [Balneolales bacterium]
MNIYYPWPYSNPPLKNRIQYNEEEQRSENYLVIPGQPNRKVNVEIIASVCGITGCHISQWTAPFVSDNHDHLNRYHADQDGRYLDVSGIR